MPTRITLSLSPSGDRPLSIRVAEDGNEILSAWSSRDGGALQLTRAPQGRRVYINPAQVLYWEEASAPSSTPSGPRTT